MKRREFIILLGSASIWPLAARAQQPRVPRIGVLIVGNADPKPFLIALREGLQKLGYIDGQNFRLEFRSAGGTASHLPELASDLVRLNVDVIVAWQTPAVTAAKQATTEIPIVMAAAGDPVGTGLIASLARPGGNITGLSSTAAELAAKMLELIRETLPSARRLAVLANATDPFTKPFLAQIEGAARTKDVEVKSIMVRPSDEFDGAIGQMASERMDAIIVQPSLLRKQAVDLALKHRLPSFSINRLLPAAGGLMSYSASSAEQYHQVAVYVDKILKGSKPADLPVEEPTRFELVINLKTAKALGLIVPPSLLARADEVIE
jgi:putative tryptophan/tyrosine transport system substrate-binding protein